MTDYKDLIVRLIARHESLYGKGAVPSCITEAADAIEALVKEMVALKEQHHLRYRMWHDEAIKRTELQHELKALRAEMEKQS